MPYSVLVEPGAKVDLSSIDPNFDAGLEKDAAKKLTKALGEEMAELQELLFATGQNGLLLVFQGPDTAGKDGAINQILEFVNVQSTKVYPFKVPTSIELAHDFLWRVHQRTPAKGEIAIFNRSHYEDVLVVRVHELIPEVEWRSRYKRINEFEKLLADSGTIILKFMLHITPEEQEERLLAREKDPRKAWKLSVNDWKERENWQKYQTAFEDALHHCSAEHAPWHVIPANKKWFRDLAVSEAIVSALRPYKESWMAHLAEVGVKAKAELAEYRLGRK
ncbi:MAG: hypothetical protein KF784_07790 [Fimbriimonadaceae bacterium]|nr:hypothetical protein [Fimbriimonadaceae bacterium]